MKANIFTLRQKYDLPSVQRIRKVFFAIVLQLSVLAVFSFVPSNTLYAQSGLCDANVPFYEVDLSADPSTTWESPLVTREGYCCGNAGADRCIEFRITLHSDAVAIIFDVESGAIPPGSMYYQIDCGTTVQVGEPVCLTGVGPHTVTFCKPGNNDNTYSITSVPEPSFTGLDVATENCFSQITVEGAVDGTITYEDLTGGGLYLSYLSCTDCPDPIIVPDDTAPEYVDYKICGDAEAEICMDSLTYCDTVRVYFHDTIAAALSPNPAEYCEYEGGLLLQVDLLNGVPPYTFEWYDGHDSTGNLVGTNQNYFATAPGPYSVVVYDSLYPQCDPVVLNTHVIEHAQPSISVDPVNPYICLGDSVSLTTSGADTYSWSPAQGLSQTSGDSVVALPNATTTYSLTGTDSNGCSDTANVTVEVCPKPDVQITTSDADICLGDSVQLDADGALMYEWTPAEGLDDPTLQNPIASPTATTTYYLSGWDVSCNLIHNWNFNDGNQDFFSEYNYNSDLQPEGNFMIGSNPNDYHGNFSDCGDHTTGDENMMIINGTEFANTKVWCQTISVIPHTDYVFSAWLTSVHPDNPAILQFSINGNLLGEPFPASSNTCEWNQFYEPWYSGDNTEIDICIVNQNTVASGNDFAIDDIFFAPMCEATDADSVTVTVHDPSVDLGPDQTHCDYDVP
ncbi:MAG: hypothetical protein ACLFM1_00410, partial [Bacteroidales bacterium]